MVGHNFVVGGAVRGGRVLNTFPGSLLEGNPNDVGRGRMVPDFPWESEFVPIAQWMGVAAEQMDTVFPNLHNFEAGHLNTEADMYR